MLHLHYHRSSNLSLQLDQTPDPQHQQKLGNEYNTIHPTLNQLIPLQFEHLGISIKEIQNIKYITTISNQFETTSLTEPALKRLILYRFLRVKGFSFSTCKLVIFGNSN